jgi:uncharacterized membrane protein
VTGRLIFSIAIIAFGIETLVCARVADHMLGPQYLVVPIMPWLPAIPWLAYLFGFIWVCCGAGIIFVRTRRPAALILSLLLFLCAIVFDVPKNIAKIGDVGLRTIVFEPVSIACLAWLMLGRDAMPGWLARGSRYLLAISLIVYGVDHFLALRFVASVIPSWLPWHNFWTVFFGIALIAAGLSIGLRILERAGAALTGLMFAIWVVTLHLPRILGLYNIPGAPSSPDEWSSMLIPVALWGGFWALATVREAHPVSETSTRQPSPSLTA